MERFQSVGDVVAALRRRLALILAIALAGSVAAVLFALSQPKQYQAVAVVQIEDPRVPEELAGAVVERTERERQVRLLKQRVTARDNLVAVMERFDLFSDDPDMPLTRRLALMREAMSIDDITANGFSPEARTPSGLFIRVRLEDPDTAAAVANALMELVIDQARARSEARVRETVDFFVAEEDRVAARILALEESIAIFKQQNGEALPEGIAALRTERTRLRETELDLDREIIALTAETVRQRASVQDAERARLSEQKALLRERIDRIDAIIAEAPTIERDLRGLERQLSQLQTQYEVAARSRAEAEMGQMLENRQQAYRFEVLETALPPESPISRSRRAIAVAGGVASLLIGVGLALLIEILSPTLRTARQMERMLGVTPVIAIPYVEARRSATETRRRRRMMLVTTAGAGTAAGVALVLVGVPADLGETLSRLLLGA